MPTGSNSCETRLLAEEEQAVIRCINIFFAAVDRRDFDVVRASLAQSLKFDYSEFGLVFPEDPALFTEMLKERFSAYARVQHVTANHIVDGADDSAVVSANFVAHHTLPGAPDQVAWSTGGRYDIVVARVHDEWRIAGITKHTTWDIGSPAAHEWSM